jgi:PadR family transcriptional regulator, regulatory protein PadR
MFCNIIVLEKELIHMLGEERSRQTSKMNTTIITKLFILHFLSQKSFYGHELSDEIEKTCHWRPSNGLIYPLLRDMEENLWVEGWWDEPDRKNKRHYKITNEGLSYYNKVKTIYKPLIKENLNLLQNTLNAIYK